MKGILIFIFSIFIILFGFIFLPGLFTFHYAGPKSDHFDGKYFFNPGHSSHKNTLSMLKWWRERNRAPWPKHVENNSHSLITRSVAPNEIKVTFINHASVLIQTYSLNILTDPIWSQRASPVSWYGPQRVRSPGIAFNELPNIDIVLISHNHYDHLDIPSLIKLEKHFHPIFIVPLGDKGLLEKYGVTHVVEMDWWQKYQVKNNISIAFLPTQHWAARWLTDRNKTLWGSYGINIGKIKIYFAGDTGYSNNFKMIRQRWGAPDLALLPIGAYIPSWFMEENHLNPEEAVKAHLDLGAKKSIAIHYGTFQLSDESIEQPVIDLNKSLKNNSLAVDKFIILPEGESIFINSN